MTVADIPASAKPRFRYHRVLVLSAAIFTAELIAMVVIEPLGQTRLAALIDACITVTLSLPMIHWSLVQPLVQTNESLKREIARGLEREIELRRAKAVYLELFENVFDGVLEVTPDRTPIRMNNALVRMLGYDSAQELAEAATSDNPPMKAESRDEWKRRILTEGAIRNFETELRRRDGTTVNVIANFLPVKDASGHLLFYQGTINDITDRTRALESEKRARNSAETMRAATLTLTRSLDLDRVLGTLLELLNAIVPFDRAEVLLVKRDGAITPRARQGRPEDEGGEEGTHSQALLQEVVRLGTPVLIDDVSRDPRWSATNVAASWLGVPLADPRGKLGLYAMYRRGKGSLTTDDALAAEALSAAVTVAVRNASLFDQAVAARARLQKLSRQVVEIQEEERRRIARELHDEAGQALTSLRIGLEIIERSAADSPQIVTRCSELRQVIDGVMSNLHALATRLRPPSLEHLGLADALREHIRSVAAQSGLDIEFDTTRPSQARVSAAVEVVVFRIVQEAITNVLRHAGARHVKVILDPDEQRIRAEIRDDGCGFDPDETGGRLGISGMRERAELLGGRLGVESSMGSGTTIVLEVPNGHTAAHRR